MIPGSEKAAVSKDISRKCKSRVITAAPRAAQLNNDSSRFVSQERRALDGSGSYVATIGNQKIAVLEGVANT